MVKVELVDQHGRREDITYVDGISLTLSGNSTPEIRALLLEWKEQRQHYQDTIAQALNEYRRLT